MTVDFPKEARRLAGGAARRVMRQVRAARRFLLRLGRPKGDRALSPPARALAWIRANELPTGGIRVHSNHASAYPEVTGYIIPTLLDYGDRGLAARLVQWLVRIQREDGAFTDPDWGKPYIFDTGQALRGLLAGVNTDPEAREAARKAAEYLCAHLIDEGRGGFHLGYADGTAGDISESIHLYVLPALVQAGGLLETPRYSECAARCLTFYRAAADTLRPSDLTHFLAYQLEALIDLGAAEAALPVLDALREQQAADGSVRAVAGSPWVCAPGLAQLVICWYKTGLWEAADRAMDWLEAHQQPSGGFLGGYGPGTTYFPEAELSWAAKFYLDAHRLRVRAFFERSAAEFPDTVPIEDGRVQALLAALPPAARVLEVGCGKGRFLRAIRESRPDSECAGADISPAMLAGLPSGVAGRVGSLESVPWPADSFGLVFSVEAVEHSANPEAAVAEMIRVATPGGRILIIDKPQAQWGRLECPPWERWPDRRGLSRLLELGCDEVTSGPVGYDGNPASDGLMVVWQGRKRA
jgi:malonyl-CoA O-methyltransferase